MRRSKTGLPPLDNQPPLLCLGRQFRGSMHHVIQKLFEILQAGCGNDDGVAPPADVFSDAEKATAWILFEREDKRLPFDLNFIRLQSVLLDWRLW